MKALSLWEPWASLIRTGAKTWETRSWGTSYRGPLLICAAKGGLSKSELLDFLCQPAFQNGLAPLVGKPLFSPCWGVRVEHLHFGKAVAIVNLLDCVSTRLLSAADIGDDAPYGDFGPDRFAWKLKILPRINPFPVVGHQGLFDVPNAFWSMQ